MTDNWLLAWQLRGLLVSTSLVRAIFSKKNNFLCREAIIASTYLWYTAAVKNSWATAILFPMEFQWLPKWRWLMDLWCQLYYTVCIKSAVYHGSNVSRAQITWITDKRSSKTLRSSYGYDCDDGYGLGLFQYLVAFSDNDTSPPPISFYFNYICCHLTLFYCIQYGVSCGSDTTFITTISLLHSSLLQPWLSLCVWTCILQGSG